MNSTSMRRRSAIADHSRSRFLGLAALEVLEQRRLLSVSAGADEHHHDDLLPTHVERLALEVESGQVRDVSGETYFYDAAPATLAMTGTPSAAEGGPGATPGAGGDLGAQLPILHSKPGAPATLFLDFDGHVVSGTHWNNYNNGQPIHAQPYSLDTDVFNFSSTELGSIQEIFGRMAEDFAPFNINVTTQDPGTSKFTAGAQALRVMISTDVDSVAMGGTGNRWFEGAGGVAYLGSWRWTNDTPVWAFENNLGNGLAKYVAEAASHEAGHAFDLRHDGQNGGDGEYYRGHGSGATSWAPIMGVGYNRSLTQWSKGDYNIASNTQDDLATITASHNKITYRADDHGNSASSATAISGIETGTSSDRLLQFKSSGIIERRTDVDVFKLDLSAGAGHLTLAVAPEVYFDGYANLDVSATLRNAAGTVVSQSNPSNGIHAFFDLDLPAGVYTLTIDGVGKGDPYTTGYTDYGSLGQYDIIADYDYETDQQQDDLTIAVNGTDRSFPASAFTSYAGQDDQPSLAIVDGGDGLRLSGNTWKKLALPYNVTADTVLEFDISAADAGEILAIGFDTDSDPGNGSTLRHFRMGGTQNWSRNYTDFSFGQFGPFSGHVTIPVGQFYTGQMQYLTFAVDDDANASASVTFSNMKVYEDSSSQNDTFTIDINGTPSQFELNSFSSYHGQDDQPSLTIVDNGAGINLSGNSWKKLALPYNVTPDTVLEFDISAQDAGEILAIGFDNDNDAGNGTLTHFRMGGIQNWSRSINGFGLGTNGPFSGRVSIPVGQFHTGAMNYLTFALDDDANASADVTYSNVKIYESSANGFDGFVEQNGLVVMEAENATGGANGTGVAAGSNWQRFNDASASGGAGIVALPNSGAKTGDTLVGARQDYAVRFSTPGTWYAWVRMLGANGSDDTAHLGIDGQALTLGHWGIGNDNGQWNWLNSIGFGAIKFDIPAAGDHVINLWMREDGVKVDKIILTRNPNYTPTGTGPGQTASAPGAGSSLFSRMPLSDRDSLFDRAGQGDPGMEFDFV